MRGGFGGNVADVAGVHEDALMIHGFGTPILYIVTLVALNCICTGVAFLLRTTMTAVALLTLSFGDDFVIEFLISSLLLFSMFLVALITLQRC